MTIVAAFDLASVTGCADGKPQGPPRLWTWDLTKVDRDGGRPAMLGLLASHLELYFDETPVTHVFYEEPLNIKVMMDVGASDSVVAMLRGCIGVLEALAYSAGVKVIEPISVQAARRHLLGGVVPKGQGKAMVMERCRVLGWKARNDNESDAAAIWSLASARANPRTAHVTTPLFARRTR